MNSPDLAFEEILRAIGSPDTEVEIRKILDEFYNDVYEEGFSDGYDNSVRGFDQ